MADAGRDAKVAKDEEWLPLGVFAMVQGDEKTSNHIFQLAVNKQGVIRGNYYDAVTDSTALIYGAVDKKTPAGRLDRRRSQDADLRSGHRQPYQERNDHARPLRQGPHPTVFAGSH